MASRRQYRLRLRYLPNPPHAFGDLPYHCLHYELSRKHDDEDQAVSVPDQLDVRADFSDFLHGHRVHHLRVHLQEQENPAPDDPSSLLVPVQVVLGASCDGSGHVVRHFFGLLALHALFQADLSFSLRHLPPLVRHTDADGSLHSGDTYEAVSRIRLFDVRHMLFGVYVRVRVL